MEMGVLNDFLQAAIPWMAMGFVVALTLATSEAQKKKDAGIDHYGSLGMCLGVCAGAAVGSMFGLTAVGMPIGMLFGLALGMCFEKPATSVLASGATASAAAGAQAASTPAGAKASQAVSTPAGALTDEGEGDANE